MGSVGGMVLYWVALILGVASGEFNPARPSEYLCSILIGMRVTSFLVLVLLSLLLVASGERVVGGEVGGVVYDDDEEPLYNGEILGDLGGGCDAMVVSVTITLF